MGDNSAIEWTDATWNVVTGCSKVSPGCAHCYAETAAIRFWPTQYPPIPVLCEDEGGLNHTTRPRRFEDVQCHEDRLEQPLRWKRPRRIFVNSMSDLFHEAVPDAFIDRIFAVMALCPQHTFQILTKRAERMRAYFAPGQYRDVKVADAAKALNTRRAPVSVFDASRVHRDEPWQIIRWPLPNVWLGVSVENQHFADERIPLLLQTPAAIRFISAEPLLGPVNLTWESKVGVGTLSYLRGRPQPHKVDWPGLDWVIVGGESGPGARRCDLAWIRSIRDQCRSAKVRCFVKQVGSRPVCAATTVGWASSVRVVGDAPSDEDTLSIGREVRCRHSHGGDPAEWPADINVREFPQVRA